MKRAVVIGINDYSVAGFNNLRWCVRDAQAFYHLLVDAFLFDPAQIFYYTDQQASRRNIERALRYCLRTSEPGDVVCFYFAGHGARLAAADGKYYETLVPASGDQICDVDLYRLADTLEPSHVNFTIVLDSCHSGGMHETQGVRSPTVEASFLQTLANALKTLIPCGILIPMDSTICNNNVSNVKIKDGMVDLDEDANKTLVAQSKSTLVSACKFSETAKEEGTALRHGLMTQSFLDLVNQSNFQITYNALIDQLGNRVSSYINTHFSGQTQTPQLRGQQSRTSENFLEGWITSE